MTLPLAGLRIVAVELYGAGPYGTQHLADLGAEVIKVENRKTGGDISRTVGPFFLGENDSEFFQSVNRNKRSLSLDLKHPRGREVFLKLIATADGLVGNMRGDQPEKLKLTYADLKGANPRIVCAHLSAYGRDSNRKGWPGYDYLQQAEAGWLWLTGEPGGPPARFGLSVVDFMTGTTTALALLAGILQARVTGQGRDVDVSLYDVAMHQLSYPAVWYLNQGHKTERVARSAHPSIAPSQLFKTQDGWLFIMAQTQKFWELLCDSLGRADLKSDPRFADYDGRRLNRDTLTEVLDAEFGKRTTADWVRLLSGTVPCGPVLDMAQALDNPYFRERGGAVPTPHPKSPGFKTVASPIRLDEPLPARPASALGADTDDILAGLGYSAGEIAELRRAEAI